ncbi:MAG: hypothetical protein RLZZ519_2864 [Bacteroidota bacterium]|jgi:uncharacterized protein YydD (DUF2326 family)
MKLVQIFANKNFKRVLFRNGFNVVLANITDHSEKKDTHNLGKTSLIHVIDFLLLAKFDRKRDKLFRNQVFDGVWFIGEFELNDGRRLMIQRQIDKPTKIGFHFPEESRPNVPTVLHLKVEWKSYTFDKARDELNTLLGFDVITDFDFRKSITYFLRTQQDYRDVYMLGKFQIGKHIDWKPFVFTLLGSDGRLIRNKLEYEEEISKKKKEIEVLRREANVNLKDRDRILGLLDVKRQALITTSATIDKFNFFEKDQAIHRDLVERIDAELQAAHSDRYRIAYELSKIEASLQKVDSELGVREMEVLFLETELHFPDTLKKQFEDLVDFNRAISTERRKFLVEAQASLRKELQESNVLIELREAEKEEALAYLTEKDSYEKFKVYQKELAKLAADIERLEDKLAAIQGSAVIEAKIEARQAEVNVAIGAIKKDIAERHHAEINKIFNGIVHDVLGTNALITIKQNKQGNVEFEADYLNPKELVATSEAQGTTYKKILCMAFDLSLLIHYSSKSFFRFVYHDGILEGLDDRIKLRLLSKVKAICKEYNIQYILSLIDSDLPLMPDGTRYAFATEEICLKLNDKDDSGRLFLHSF